MSSLAVADRIIPLTYEGRLVDLNDWSIEFAEVMAALDRLVMTSDHWAVIDFMRAYYREFGISPILKLLRNGLKDRYGEAKATKAHLDRLFPQNVLYQGTRIAGIPAPCLDAELDQNDSQPGRDGVTIEQRQPEQFEFEGTIYRVNQTGNLLDPHVWNKQVAEYMAGLEGIQLSHEHWAILNYLRKFFFNYGITPMVKILIKHLKQDIGPDKADRDYLYRLFPKGPSRQGSRIAGLPAPQGCMDP